MLRVGRDVTAAKAFSAAIRHQGQSPKTITLDGDPALERAVRQMKADSLLSAGTQVRSLKYLNNLIEVRHEVAYRSCSHFPPHRRREPPVSPGESRSLNQERL
jgi:putative transposase